jgi:putative ABC transport system permease protein
MKGTNLIKLAVKAIVKNKMRSLLTMLGIIIGVGAVIVMVAIGEGAQRQIQGQINSLGTNLIVVFAGTSQQGGVSRGAGSFARLTLEDYEKLQREGTLFAGVSPVVRTFTQAIGGGTNWRTSVMGVSVDFFDIREWPLVSGSYFDLNDVRSQRKVAVIGKTVADQLYPGQDPVGQQIQLRNVPFQIVGVLAEKGQGATGEDQDDVIVSPYTTVMNRLHGWRFIQQMLVSAYSPADILAAQEEIRVLMRESHRLAEWDEDDFTIRNQTDLAETFTETTRVMALLLASIAGISLIVGGIGIMNIMLVSVTERTREIGIRLAIGARGGDVMTQFLVESIVLSVLGGLMGVLIGYAATRALSGYTGWGTVVAPEAVILALVFSAGVGIFFGFYPARKAAALNPIEALRYE